MNLINNISDMSKLSLPHWVSSHLSVIYFSILPIFLMASLVLNIQVLTTQHLTEPLSTFGLLLPAWGIPMGWSLAFLPISPIVFWAIVHCIWGDRGVQSIQPTEQWGRNEKFHLKKIGGKIDKLNPNSSNA
eukprot:TRINITY_DN24410_c0_g1_i1.p1 TRINITY_DN24410_c0_g1~~TRINITY_DN24410_c0_g1_i1.p1  ORF type:complete len:131 (+),score=23.98 TRINITY_DN24410_c0_g1_i1:1-393(+)